jgi:alkylation response protein AidB-like acyl-CoA dehydrogenase
MKGVLLYDKTVIRFFMAKRWTTELLKKVNDQCLQLHGGYGYMEDYDIARAWRDGRVQTIYGGTTEIMKEVVGKSLGLGRR